MMTESSPDRLPPLVYAQASTKSLGGTSMLDVDAIITAGQARNFGGYSQASSQIGWIDCGMGVS